VNDIAPEGSEASLIEALHGGLNALFLNAILKTATGEDTDVSFKNLAPADIEGVYSFLTSTEKLNISSLTSESPSWQAFGRVGEALGVCLETFGGKEWEDTTDSGLKTCFESIVKVSSGFNNADRARLALKHGKLYSDSNVVRDTSVTTPQAALTAFGFSSHSEVTKWAMIDANRSSDQQRSDYLKKVVEGFSKDLKRAGVAGDDPFYTMKIWAHVYDAMELSPRDHDIISKHLRKFSNTETDAIADAMKLLGGHDGVERARASVMMSGDQESIRKWKEYENVLTGKDEEGNSIW
jgi:hypothetical protein